MLGWKLNAWLAAIGIDRLPIVGRLWFSGKRLIAQLLSSGQGVPIQLGGHQINIHPFTIAYGIDTWEPYTTELFQNALKPGSTVLDIGAHHGYFSLLAARCVGPEGRIYAFEPAPENFKILKKNIELNHLTNVFPVNKAVSDKAVTLPFFFRQQTGVTGSLFNSEQPDEMRIQVECVTIDEYLDGESVDVVKMDIEGGEPFALNGMKNTLSRSNDMVLFVEIDPACLLQAGMTPETLLAQLDDAGFKCQDIDEAGGTLRPIDAGAGFCNIYCVKTSTADSS